MERVKNGVVLYCAGNDKEGACDMQCEDVKMKCFSMSDSTLQPRFGVSRAKREKSRACASGLSAVFTSSTLSSLALLPLVPWP